MVTTKETLALVFWDGPRTSVIVKDATRGNRNK
jgi:hypothetical protein